MSNVISNKSVKNYEDALKYLQGKNERPFAHNTRILKSSTADVIAITYHNNAIVNFNPGFTVFSSCGWKTSTTKERLNWFLPDGFGLWQEKSVWYISDRNSHKRYNFADGITIDYEGNVSNAGSLNDFEETKLIIKKIKKYVENYISALLLGDVPAPSGGDCWFCYMEGMEGSDHLFSHMEEEYYVPSLVTKAVAYKNICPMAKGTIANIWYNDKLPESKWEIEIMTRDLKSSMTAYFKHKLNIAA